MCHESPSAQFLGALATILGDFFVLWHLWKYDRFRCMLFSKRSAFRFIIVWMFLISSALFTAWNVILVWVKYTEYYAVVPISKTESEIMPVPFQLWSERKRTFVRFSYQLLGVAWGIVLAIHSEETLYWAYLINAIRKRDSRNWFRSIWFKIWVFISVTVITVIPAVGNMETTNLIKMEANIFMAGSILATLLFFMSLWLYLVFPGFVDESRRQGANAEVLTRLEYFKEMNGIRTLFRFLYVFCILTLSIDGQTKHKHVNTTPFWLDLFFVCGLFFVFTSNGLSLMILLPRNTTFKDETRGPNVFIRPPRSTHRRDMQILPSTSTIGSHKYDDDNSGNHYHNQGHRDIERGQRKSNPWGALGERLNIEKTRLSGLDEIESGGAVAIALESDMHQDRNRTMESLNSRGDAPFAPTGGERILRPGEGIDESPEVFSNFRSPGDVPRTVRPTEVNIVVRTEQVIEKA
ncbi:uncharacterized protein I303_102154 [Kwoniella dejecticola CBS 10117]|uniref:Uncharacterized protein n=1 Tax=Kwoniella dejecticola CBS 10117 TaxID=1296121 RepID=A0A1A6ABR3_9TREE|nr:uncharacterized protein I303_01705 [Kwoniella dejecticola CBS 10117]OBR87499.1 hypothetical protein I303_01705 [Kwoniella dejecticola CBS 10117]